MLLLFYIVLYVRIDVCLHATNLTYLTIGYGINDFTEYLANIRDRVIGSINSLSALNKIKNIEFSYCWNCIGNINTAYVSMNKLVEIWQPCAYHNGSKITTSNDYTSDKISGNINVFANKYDLINLSLARYSTITGEVSSLKNLKKLWFCNFERCSITGSRTDLYNNGANLTRFLI